MKTIFLYAKQLRDFGRIIIFGSIALLLCTFTGFGAEEMITPATEDILFTNEAIAPQVSSLRGAVCKSKPGNVASEEFVVKTPIDVKAVYGKNRKTTTYVYDNAHYTLVSMTDVDGKLTKYPQPHDLYPEHVTTQPGVRDEAETTAKRPAGRPLEQGFTTVVYDAETGLVLSITNDTTGTQQLFSYTDDTVKECKSLKSEQMKRIKEKE